MFKPSDKWILSDRQKDWVLTSVISGKLRFRICSCCLMCVAGGSDPSCATDEYTLSAIRFKSFQMDVWVTLLFSALFKFGNVCGAVALIVSRSPSLSRRIIVSNSSPLLIPKVLIDSRNFFRYAALVAFICVGPKSWSRFLPKISGASLLFCFLFSFSKSSIRACS